MENNNNNNNKSSCIFCIFFITYTLFSTWKSMFNYDILSLFYELENLCSERLCNLSNIAKFLSVWIWNQNTNLFHIKASSCSTDIYCLSEQWTIVIIVEASYKQDTNINLDFKR